MIDSFLFASGCASGWFKLANKQKLSSCRRNSFKSHLLKRSKKTYLKARQMRVWKNFSLVSKMTEKWIKISLNVDFDRWTWAGLEFRSRVNWHTFTIAAINRTFQIFGKPFHNVFGMAAVATSLTPRKPTWKRTQFFVNLQQFRIFAGMVSKVDDWRSAQMHWTESTTRQRLSTIWTRLDASFVGCSRNWHSTTVLLRLIEWHGTCFVISTANQLKIGRNVVTTKVAVYINLWRDAV